MDYLLPPSGFDVAGLVLKHLHEKPSSRNEIAKAFGISRTSLSRALEDIADEGPFVRTKTVHGDSPGRPVQLLEFDPTIAYSVGIDLARSRSTGVMLNRLGEPIVKTWFPSNLYPDAMTRAIEVCDRLIKEADKIGANAEYIARVGVGVPIPVGQRPEIEQWRKDVLAPHIYGLWPVPVLVDNTVRFGALGEAYWGAGKGKKSQFYVRLSKGVGGGFVISALGSQVTKAGEFGHITVPGGSKQCYCGKLGCLETVASVDGICSAAGVADLEGLRKAIDSEDARAVAAVEEVASTLGWALGMLQFAVNPEIIILSGEVVEVIPEIAGPIEQEIRKHLMPQFPHAVSVAVAELEHVGPALGAAYAVEVLVGARAK
ncbi:MAG: ROK family transcriptional regulator [Actinomycetaceae bacterium]|nr:ROK family transcriptional regulator [Actinomycetaceae bacterium]